MLRRTMVLSLVLWGVSLFALLARGEAAEPQNGNTLYLPAVAKLHTPGYVSPFGIAMFGSVDNANGLEAMRVAGSGWVMTNVEWSVIQPTELSAYNWSAYDTKFINAAAAGMRIYVLFDQNPSWAAPGVRTPLYDGKLPALKAVVQAMVERYNGSQPGLPRIDYWSFYGEPDAQTAWGNNGAQFAAMLKEIAPVVHAANPNAKVMIGGIAYDWFTTDAPAGPHVRDFITATLTTLNTTYGGAANYIDAMAFHFYPVSPARWPTLREKTAEIRSILSNHGLGNLPLIMPEIGMWSVWPGLGERQQQQAQWLVHFYTRGWSVGLQQMYWFQVFDITPPRPYGEQGLFVGTDLNQPKQAYFAYQTMTRELDRARYVGAISVPGAEGYTFTLDGRSKTVVWGTGDTPTEVDFPLTCARQVAMLGSVTTIFDGGAGDVDTAANGLIRFTVTRDEPIYVDACP